MADENILYRFRPGMAKTRPAELHLVTLASSRKIEWRGELLEILVQYIREPGQPL